MEKESHPKAGYGFMNQTELPLFESPKTNVLKILSARVSGFISPLGSYQR